MSLPSSPPSASSPNRRVFVLLGAAAFVLLACLVGGFVVMGQNAQPGGALVSYCAALTRQKYADAYGMLSAGARAKMSQDQYAQASQYRDQIDGKVSACDAPQAKSAGIGVTFLNASAVYNMRITRNKAATGKVLLTHQVDGWKVDKLEPQLLGTDVDPVFAAQDFCGALAKGDYATAYADLSGRYKSGISQADWTKKYTDAISAAGAKVTACAPNIGAYSVSPASAVLEMQVQIQVTTGSGSATVPFPLKLTLVPEGGTWKVDDIKAAGAGA